MTKLRKTALAFGTACAVAFTGGFAALNALPANADTKSGNRGYYGTKLDGIAGAFYDELVKMTEDPDGEGTELSTLRKGESHTVTNNTVITQTLAAEYAAGDMNLIKQFGAALDCFRYDYADLFYVNFDRLTVHVTEKKTETGGGSEEGDGNGGTGSEPTTPETQDGEGVDGSEGDPTPDPTPDPAPEYVITIGAGRAVSYLLFDPDELNGTAEAPEPPSGGNEGGEPGGEPTTLATKEGEGEAVLTLYGKYVSAYEALIEKVNNVLQPPAEGGEAPAAITYSNFSVEERVKAVNKVLGESFTYGFGNNYVNTTYFITEANKPNASSEGFARLFKTVMHTLEVDDCLIVSGYYMVNGTAKACTWNYVKDGGKWYGVDVANNLTNDNKYLLATGDVFFLDHYENGVVSLSNYQLKYPETGEFAFENYHVVTGEIQVANGALGNRNGIVVVEYNGERGVLSIRVKNGEEWGAWTALNNYETDNRFNIPQTPEPPSGGNEGGEPGGEPTTPETKEGEDVGDGSGDGNGDTPPVIDETNCKVAYDAEKGLYYLFDLEDGKYEIAIVKDGAVVERNETVAESIDQKVVSIPLAENDLRLKAQELKETAFEITFGSKVKIGNGTEVVVDFTVDSLEGAELEFVKKMCTLGTATLSEDGNTLSFQFKPCALTQYSGLKYTFTFPNLVEDAENGTAVPQSYSVVFKYEGNAIRATGVSVGSNLYTDIVTQPSLVFNNDLSLSGWKYDGIDANDNMIGALALTAGKINVSEDLNAALKEAVTANGAIFDEGAFNVAAPSDGEGEGGEGTPVTPNSVEAYSLNLTLDGKAVTIPSGSALKLSFPYPAGHGPQEGDDTVYKIFQFNKDESGNIDYTAAPAVLDVVAARQGLIAAVNDPSANFVIVAFDKAKIKGDSKVVLTETTGVGGSIGGSPVNKVSATGSQTYTIKADDGYVLDSVSVNGVAKDLPEGNNGTYTFSLNGADLTNTTFNVLRVEFRPAGENVSADDYKVTNGSAAGFVTGQLERGEYSADEKNSIITDYPVGGIIFAPKPPVIPNTASTQMQMIIVLSVVGGIALIGAIAIIYCGAIRPKILREREEEAARIAAQREKRANRNRSGSSYDSKRR